MGKANTDMKDVATGFSHKTYYETYCHLCLAKLMNDVHNIECIPCMNGIIVIDAMHINLLG